MIDQTTARLGMPLLAAGQSNKELTHNEALVELDMLVQPVVVAINLDTPPAAPAIGGCWIVGAAPTGAWAGRSGALAGWTGGGWRFVTPSEGFEAWCTSSAKPVAYRDGLWREGDISGTRVMIDGVRVVGPRGMAVADPAGGTVVDDAARSTIAAILSAMRQHGLIAG